MSNGKKTDKNKYASRKRFWAAVCAIILAVAFLTAAVLPMIPVGAASATDLQKQVNQAKKSREAAKKQLDNVKANKANVSQEVINIDADITRAEDEIESTEFALEQSKIALAQKEQELAIAEQNCVEYDDDFKTRARIMYENGTGTYLEVLFGASSFGDFLSRVEMVKEIVEYDKKVLAELVASRNAINEARIAVQTEKEGLELRQAQLEQTKAELADRLEAKQLLLKQLESDLGAYQKAFEQAEAAEAKAQKELQKELAALAAKEAAEAKKKNQTYTPPKYTGSGKFSWPCPASSRITSYYGYRTHPIYKTKKFHSGIDIGAGYGSAIIAAESGTVVSSGNKGGYGKCVVLSHGSGLTTLYGHCSSLLVKAGDKVSKGQTIAKVGSTGVSTGNHLHFEVRVNGSTTDPLSYVK